MRFNLVPTICFHSDLLITEGKNLPTAPPRESNPAKEWLLAPAIPNVPPDGSEADTVVTARQHAAAAAADVTVIPFIVPVYNKIIQCTGDVLLLRSVFLE